MLTNAQWSSISNKLGPKFWQTAETGEPPNVKWYNNNPQTTKNGTIGIDKKPDGNVVALGFGGVPYLAGRRKSEREEAKSISCT